MHMPLPARHRSLRDASSRRGRRPMLRFAPLASKEEDAAVSTSPVGTSASSSGSASPEIPPETRERAASGSHTTDTAYYVASVLGDHDDSAHERSPSPNVFEASTLGNERSQRGATPAAVHPLSEDEVRHVKASHTRYMESMDNPRRLLTFLQDLTASNGVAECEQWLKQLEILLSTSRNQLVGGKIRVGIEEGKEFGGSSRPLSEEEAMLFATWLKSTQGGLAVPPSSGHAFLFPPKNRGEYEVSGGSSGLCENAARGDLHTPPPVAITGKAWAAEAGDNSVSGGEWSSRLPYLGKQLGLESIVNSARNYMLEHRVFAELGGGDDGSGTIRIVDFKRLLAAFNFDADFTAFVGQTVDLDRTGRITFDEFLWVLEFGVRSKGPAAATHRPPAAPMNDSGTSCAAAPSRSSGRQTSSVLEEPRRKSEQRDALPSLARAPSRQEKIPTRKKSRAGNNGALKRRKLTEDLRRNSPPNIWRLSPYTHSMDPELSLGNSIRSLNHRCRTRHSTRSMSTTPRLPSSSAKSVGAPSVRGTGNNRKHQSTSRASTQEFQSLRDQQLRLTKRLEVLTGLPVSVYGVQHRQDELIDAQEELNSVLRKITIAIRDHSVGEADSVV